MILSVCGGKTGSHWLTGNMRGLTQTWRGSGLLAIKTSTGSRVVGTIHVRNVASSRGCAWREHMRRREFITLAGGAAAAYYIPCSRDSRAQQAGKPVIGLLNGQNAAEVERYVTAFRQSIKEA